MTVFYISYSIRYTKSNVSKILKQKILIMFWLVVGLIMRTRQFAFVAMVAALSCNIIQGNF